VLTLSNFDIIGRDLIVKRVHSAAKESAEFNFKILVISRNTSNSDSFCVLFHLLRAVSETV